MAEGSSRPGVVRSEARRRALAVAMREGSGGVGTREVRLVVQGREGIGKDWVWRVDRILVV